MHPTTGKRRKNPVSDARMAFGWVGVRPGKTPRLDQHRAIPHLNLSNISRCSPTAPCACDDASPLQHRIHSVSPVLPHLIR
jgi:hypothetical protein